MKNPSINPQIAISKMFCGVLSALLVNSLFGNHIAVKTPIKRQNIKKEYITPPLRNQSIGGNPL